MSEVNHLPQLISDLAYILIIAAPATLFFKRIKQPIVLGYILAGFFVGPHFSFSPTVIDLAGIKVWAEIGVIFLLFSLGLEFSLKKLMSVGKSAGITALLEVPFMLLCGYLLGRAFGWTKIDSLFLGGIISISSTTIIIRAFDELGFKSRKFVGQVFGILIIEDLFAILLLVLLSMLSVTNVFSGVELVSTVVKLGFFLVAWFVAGLYLIPISLEKVRSLMNEETTLILAVGFCLLMVMLATSAGYSPALGAFVMGSILGETRHVKSIEHVFKPVKNIFSAIFFVSVGMLIDPAIILNNFHLILIVFFVTILGKFFSNFFGSLIAGQGIKNSIQTGMSLANIGEFSFIIATLGITLKVTNQVIYPVAVAVSAITVFTTPYQIKYSERLFNWVESHLSLELLKRLNNYQYAMRHGNPESALFVLFKRSSLKIIINIVIVTAIAVVSKKYLLPMTYSFFDTENMAKMVVASFSIVTSGPFFWPIVFAGTNELQSSSQYRSFEVGFVILKAFIVVVLIGFLVRSYFPLYSIYGMVLFLSANLFMLFIRFTGPVYALIERSFIQNVGHGTDTNEIKSNELAPWEHILIQYVISPFSVLIFKSLSDSKIKEKYGITVALIERGEAKIVAPKSNELLMPHDRLYLIGDEAELERFRLVVEAPYKIEQSKVSADFGLVSVIVKESTIFKGQAIKDCGFRESVNGLVVGVEKNGKRLLSPSALTILDVGDTVWIVGEKKLIATVIGQMTIT